MSDRRTALKALAGVSVAAAWHKPLLNSVVLPAHAQTSVDPLPPISRGNKCAECRELLFDEIENRIFEIPEDARIARAKRLEKGCHETTPQQCPAYWDTYELYRDYLESFGD